MFEQKQVLVNGLVVNYILRQPHDASAPALIFLHGWRSSGSIWLPVLSAFTDFHIYALDLPGFGKSERPPQFFRVDDYADCVVSWMQKLDIHSAYIVGHSFGGRVALKLAARYPDAVAKLVLVDSSGIRFHSALKRMSAIAAKILSPLFSLRFLKPIREYAYRAIGADDYLATPELKGVFKNIIEEDTRPLLPAIKTKTLIVWGEKDKETPVRAASILKNGIPDAQLVILKNAGHMSFLDQPAEFEARVLEFLK